MLQSVQPAIILSGEERTPTRRHATRHIPALDGIRGLAILLVLVHHFSGGADPTTAVGRAWLAWTNNLWIGVDLFFVLSGFLITGILLDTKKSAGYFRNFYARRALRIFPLYYGVLLAAFFALPAIEPYIRQEAGKGFSARQSGLWLYLTNVIMAARGPDYFWAFDHFWSLAVEEHFYLVWPLAILLCNRRATLRLCVIVAVLALALRTTLTLVGVSPTSIYVLTPCRMDVLAIGGLAALLVRSRRPDQWFLWARPGAITSGIALFGLMVARHGLSQDDPIVQTAGFSLLAIFFASILLLAVGAPSASLIGRFWTLQPLRFTGKLAYGLYVFHPFFIIPLARFFEGPHGRLVGFGHLTGIVLFATFGIAASLVTALLSWHFYEKHFVRLKAFFECKPQERAPRPTMSPTRGRRPVLAATLVAALVPHAPEYSQ